MEIGGYAARILSNKRPYLVSAFVAQYFLIVVVRVLARKVCLRARLPSCSPRDAICASH